jgi:hypothetical protein
MDGMTSKTAVFLLFASLLPAVQASAKTKAILPDACGDDSIQFDAKQEKDSHAFAGPAEGKALIVFVENMPNEMKLQTTTRFGLDGAWAGATKGDSYFTVEVAPGEHNLCASMQSVTKRMKKDFTQIASVQAEAGKIYYFEAALNVVGARETASARKIAIESFAFTQLTDADGKYRIKAWKFATSTAKK